MPVLVPANGFTQQIDEFVKQLRYLTDSVEVGDDEGAPVRSTSFLVEVPDSTTGSTTVFDYREEFRRTEQGWLRSRYYFELRVSRPNAPDQLQGRRAHHEHGIWGIHQHCETSTRPDDHHVDVERLMQATNELFLTLFASGSPIECSGLTPVSALREQARPGDDVSHPSI